MMNSTTVICLLAGLFSIIAAALNLNFFMESRKARLFVKLFTRNGARIFYVILGIVVIVLGFKIN